MMADFVKVNSVQLCALFQKALPPSGSPAHLAWRETYRHSVDEERPREVIDRLVNRYRGRIEANDGPPTDPALAAE